MRGLAEARSRALLLVAGPTSVSLLLAVSGAVYTAAAAVGRADGAPAATLVGTVALLLALLVAVASVIAVPVRVRHLGAGLVAWWWSLAVALAAAGASPSPGRLVATALLVRPPGAPVDVVPAAGAIAVVALIGAVVAVRGRSRRASDTHRRCDVGPSRHRSLRWLAVAMAVGTFTTGPAAVWLFVRQVPERLVPGTAPAEFAGPVTMPLLWALFTATASGVVALALWSMLAVPRRRGSDLLTRRLALVAVVAGGFLLRLTALFVVAPRKTDLGDPLYYHTTANVLARGGGFREPLRWIAFGTVRPSAFHGPLYPLVLSVSSRIGGTGYLDHKMTSVLIGTATVAAVGVLGAEVWRRVVATRPSRVRPGHVAVLAAGLAAVNPSLWLIDGLLFPEGLMTLLVTLLMILAYRWLSRDRVSLAAALGLLLGLTALTRGEGLLLAAVMVLPLVWWRRDLSRPRRLLHLAVAGGACVAVLAPWTLRNLVTFEEFVPLSTNGDEVFVYANCDTAYAGKFAGWWDFQCQERIRATGDGPDEDVLDESQVATFWRRIGVEYARDHVGALPRVVALRVLRQWELARPWQNTELGATEGRDPTASRVALGQYYAMFALSGVGLVVMRRARLRTVPLVAQFVGVTITAAVVYGTVRFRAPAEPALCVLAAVGAVPTATRLLRWFRRPYRSTDVADAQSWVLGGRRGLVGPPRRVWRTWAMLGGIVALVGLAVPGLMRSTGGNMEEGFMLVFPELLLRGAVPNRDFLHLYGPASLHLLAGWYWLFGVTVDAERLFGLLQHLALLAGLFALARPWGRWVAGGVTALGVAYVLAPVGLTAMAWNGGLALAVWSVVVLVRGLHVPRPRDAVIVSGVLAGLALSHRPDLAVALLAVHVWAWRRHRHAGSVLGGAVIGSVPMLVHLALVGPGPALQGMVLDPVVRLRPGRELPRPPSWSTIDGSLQAVAELVPPWWGLPHLPAPASLVVWFFVMLAAPLVLLVVARAVARRGRRTSSHAALQRSSVLTAVALLSLGLVPQALQRPDSAHLGWVTCVSIPMLVVAVVEVLHRVRPSRGMAQRAAVATASIVALTLVVAPLFTFRTWLLHVRVGIGQVPAPFVVSSGERRYFLGDRDAAIDSQLLVDDLREWSSPGERLIVGPSDLRRTWYSDAFLYHLLPELRPGTIYIEMDPGLANADDAVLADEMRVADWVVLTGFWDGWLEPNTSMEFGNPEPMEVLDEQYCLAREYPRGLVRLYRRCR